MSHHPPSVAHHAEGRGWTLWQNFTMSSKFRGKYLQVTPQGTAHCKFAKSGNHYTWKKVTTTVNNIIVGKLWIDQVSSHLQILLLILSELTDFYSPLKLSENHRFSDDFRGNIS